ncbi:MAG: putative metal-dependent HD superfamily phosphohydrolase [Verrucomicrobiales bacterium]|jgi:predicted metal-dependent HD superfamily phosphohydrolase
MKVRWRALMGNSAAADEAFDRLEAAYGEESRAYHNLTHITDLLNELDSAPAAAGEAVEIAIWYHDVVYDSHAKDNEAQSAAWAKRDLVELGFAKTIRNDVERLILATRHDIEISSKDEKQIISLDLSTLGKSSERYADYAKAIRREYSWVAENEYNKGRASVLSSFLDRPEVFPDEWFRDRYESQARKNLTWELGRLKSGQRFHCNSPAPCAGK